MLIHENVMKYQETRKPFLNMKDMKVSKVYL